MSERMAFRSKELVVEKVALEAAIAKEEVRRRLGAVQGVFSHAVFTAGCAGGG